MRHLRLGKAQGMLQGWWLGCTPFRNRQEGMMVTQDGGNGQGEDGGERIARPLASTWIRNTRKRSANIPEWQRERNRSSCRKRG
jgi:hypothetical protein